MMSADWRALCEELLRHAEIAQSIAVGDGLWDGDEDEGLLDRARAVLAAEADGPAVPEGREPAYVVGEPSDEELRKLAAAEMDNAPNWEEPEYSYESGDPFPYEAPGVAWVNFARAVLARWGHQPAPPAAGEVGELVALLRYEAREADLDLMTAEQCHRAADLLEQRHPAPVPVAERLPGPGDCDGEGQVWVSYERPDWKATIFWELMTMDQAMEWAPVDSWLPATALPIPAGEVQP